ncbi:cyclase family protein [Nocardia bovistercoris]|uniref:Cyclase family protein n=1 Tax=Nocardia bovistercoris TaxID=2785916 RepID=A0A931I915_9NOCA|nr:cyclase family protein [Nocardia bovistercoris]MBH0775585.1 cyclase family protein [Nocardia bovistercoris]
MCAPGVVRSAHENAARPSRRGLLGALGAAAVATTVASAAPRARAAAPQRVIDLTHTIAPGMPVWPGNPPPTLLPVALHAAGGFAQHALAMWEHTGTHLDAPVHRVPGGLSTEAIAAPDLLAPLVVIDISAKAVVDPDATLTRADIDDWQTRYGAIPPRAFVAMYSGWERRFADAAAFVNLDGDDVPHAPGIDPEAARYLVSDCDVVGVGVDTLSLDAATSPDYDAHTAILGAGRYGVEMLADLGAAPASGATVVVGAPKHAGGTGGPCRVLALV